MIDNRWARVKALFEAAVERPTGQRHAFLSAAAAEDEDLRRDVESLLESDAAPASLLDRLPVATGLSAGSRLEVPSTLDSPHAETPPLPPQRIGAYEIGARLGTGGMGEVYQSRDTKLNRDVALKVLPAAFALDPARLARFKREAQFVATLNHSNIAAIYALEESTDVLALVLELVDGPTLADWIGRGPIPLDEALAVAKQIAEALEAAHEQGIVHRDLKPANVKVRPDGLVKVLDFGLAKALAPDPAIRAEHGGEPSSASLDETRDGLIMGTAAYMSPEQAKGLPVDRRSDIWAFGCVLFEMLAGGPAFRGPTVSAILAVVVKDEPDWGALPSGLPDGIHTLLRRCLRKDLRQRLQAIGDARLEIDAVQEARAGRGDVSEPRHLQSAGSRKWLPWVGAGALAGAVAVWAARGPAVIQADPLADAKFTRFTDWEGTEGGAEISPDGHFVAFLADRAGQFDIWLSQVGTGTFRNLTADVDPLQAIGPTFRKFGFSGDGADIWFSPDTGPAMAQMIMPVIGGSSRAFLDRSATAPAWSSDGSHLAYFKNRDGDPMFVADRGGADPQQIFEGEHNHNPVWSADGQWIYFARGADPTETMNIWRIRPTGEAAEQLTQGGTAVNFMAPIDTRTLLYVARAEDRSGPWLWALDVQRKVPRRVNSGLGQYTSVSASRDGRRVVATVANPTSSLWDVPLLARQADDGDVQPYLLPTGRALSPRFSGASLFYLSASGTGDGLWRAQDGETTEVAKVTAGGLFEPPAISRDGTQVALIVRRDGKRRLMLVSADGRSSRTLASSLEIEGTAGQGTLDWSPDGTWLAVGGRDAVGEGLFRVPVDGSSPTRLVAGRAWNPVWSPDGQLIVYAGKFFTGQVELLAVHADGTPTDFPAVRTRPGGYRFLPDGTGLIYLPFIPSVDFWLFDFAAKTSRQLTHLSNQGAIGNFDITADGRQIVFDRTREHSDIVLIELPK